MATSGTIIGNSFGGGKRYVFCNWQLAGQDVAGNYSVINYQAYARFINSDAQLDDSRVMYNDGAEHDVVRNTGRVYNYAGNFSNHDVHLGSGSFVVYHGVDGNKAFGLYAQIAYYGDGYSSAYQVFDLPQIPRAVSISNVTGSYTDDNLSPTVSWSPNGNRVDIKVELIGGGWSSTANPWKRWNNVGGSSLLLTFTGSEINDLRSRLANATSATMRFTIITVIGGTDTYYSYIDRTFSIVNANPTFLDFDYSDTNGTTSALTGDNQVLIQGKSTLSAVVAVADKMVANKYATAVSYTASIDGVVDTEAYSSGVDVTMALGTVAGSGSRTLGVQAKDSRNNTTTVNKSITVIPYSSPVLDIVATRQNNFEDLTTLEVSGTFSRLTVGGVDKNSIVTGSLEYRKRQDGGAWGAWTDLTWSQSTGTFTATDALMSLVNSSVWDIEVRVTDQLETVTESITVGRGVPIFFIADDEEKIGVNKMPDTGGRAGMYLNPSDNLFNMVYPIGSIYMSVVNTNPATFFGGTWVAWGTGRVPVGVDTSQSEFDTVEETGGAKTHTHALAGTGHANITGVGSELRMERVSGATINQNHKQGGFTSAAFENYNTDLKASLSGSTGSGSTLQPYITCYMWKRTA